MYRGRGQQFFGPGGPGDPGGRRFVHFHHDRPLTWLLVALLVALIVVLAAWLATRLARRGTGPQPGAAVAVPLDGALDTVRLRYARGEIAREEFLRLSADLGAPLSAA